MHQKSGSLCKGFCENRIRHGRAAELCQVIPKFVVARPLHLAYARPLCGLKAPLGLSLLRKRQFLHSILFFQVRCSFVCSASRCAAFGVIGTAQSAKEKQKRDMQLDHLRAPIFVFIRKTALSAACGGSSPEGRASCASTERYYFWFEEKRLSQMPRCKEVPPFGGAGITQRCLRGFTSRSPPADGTLLPRRPWAF